MNRTIKKGLKEFLNIRLIVVTVAFTAMFLIIFARVFTLQVLEGSSYQENFSSQIHKTIALDATRGNICDCNGQLLAYNDLSYSLMISDNGFYNSVAEKNELLNSELAEIIGVLHAHGEEIYNNFPIVLGRDGSYTYNISGTALNRFLADVFGKPAYSDLGYSEKYGIDQPHAKADEIMRYLMGEDMYAVSDSYDKKTAYQITVLRYAISANLYARYKTTTIAEHIGEETIAYMSEHSDTLTGVTIEETTTRVYDKSVCFASIIGYTGRISAEEYAELSATDPSYTANDIVGKGGLEQYYEHYLKGDKGEREVYINNVGKVTEVISTTPSTPGNDLYITIDSELQQAVYQLLEQEIAGIVYANIQSKSISMEDIYFALIDNDIVDISHFTEDTASVNEKSLDSVFREEMDKALSEIDSQLKTGPQILNDMSDLTVGFFTYIMGLLRSQDLLVSGRIDGTDSVYNKWVSGKMSPKDYLNYCIEEQWIDSSLLNLGGKYADTQEVYKALCTFLLDYLEEDKEFAKLVYHDMFENKIVGGKALCLSLFDQGVLKYDEDQYNQIRSGELSPATFLMDKINRLEITPAQLALDPCTGSCVMSDPRTGEIRALVSYPGYDGNKLANGVDAKYFAQIQTDKSNPQWNYATQEKTAPGSTFKMVTSVAGLAEKVITTGTRIQCTGKFTEVDNEPQCWIYAQKKTHGKLNVSEALRDSCNVFYYTLGYELSKIGNNGVYNDPTGIEYINKYASIFGLDRKTGIEIAESTPELADEYPVMAAIGQSNINLTTISLSRYLTAIASGNVYDYQLMSKICDAQGNVITANQPYYEDVSGLLSDSEWNSIRTGMRMVCNTLSVYKDCKLHVAGKTGTAQQIETRPNHALFVGYCPYENPEITIALRIAYGNSSNNAASAAKNILNYYFGEYTLEELLAEKASGVNGSSSNHVTD